MVPIYFAPHTHTHTHTSTRIMYAAKFTMILS